MAKVEQSRDWRYIGRMVGARVTMLPRRVRRRFPEQYAAESGLDIERPKAFLRARGLRTQPFAFADKSRIAELRAIFRGLVEEEFWEAGEGFYSNDLDLTLVLSDHEARARSSPVFTEGLIVHELAHATAAGRNLEWPPFFEEGFAELMRVRYVERFAGPDYFRALGESIGNPEANPDRLLSAEIPAAGRGTSIPVKLPIKYWHVTTSGFPRMQQAAPAGWAMELLEQAKPGFEDDLVAARLEKDAFLALCAVLDRVGVDMLTFGNCEYSGEQFAAYFWRLLYDHQQVREVASDRFRLQIVP